MECILVVFISDWKLRWGSVKYSSTGIWNVFWTVIISCWKLCWESVKLQFHIDMECILVYCIYLLLKSSAEESNTVSQGYGMYFNPYLFLTEKFRRGKWEIQFHRGLECILDCNYLLLKAPLGRESNTVPQGYGKYFRLYFSLIDSSAGGGGQVQFHKDMEVF